MGGILAILVALSWSELSAMAPRSGAIVRYPFWSHGSYTGFMFGWAYFLTAVFVPAIEVESVLFGIAAVSPGYTKALTTTKVFLGTPIPVLTSEGVFFAALLMIGFFFLNYFGVRLLGKVNTVVTAWKVIIPVVTFITLFTLFKSGNFSLLAPGATSAFTPFGWTAVFYAIPTSGVFFAYLGFRQALEYGGEAKNPQRDIPIATIGTLVIAIVLYTLLQISYIGSINWANAGVTPGNWVGLGSSFWSILPLKYAVSAGSGAFFVGFAIVLLFDSWISPSGTAWIYLGTSTRSLYGLSVEGYFPRALNSVHETWRIPWVALLVSLIVGTAIMAPLPSWYELVGLITSTSALTYVTGGAILPVFRKYAAGLRRPFRLPVPWVFAGLSFVASALVLFWSGFTLMTWVFIAIYIGIGIYLIYAVPLKMGARGALPVALGVLTFVVLGILAYFGPVYMANETVPNTFLWSVSNGYSDVLYFVIFGLLTMGMPLVIWRLVRPELRRHVSAGFWIGVWTFAFYLDEYFSAFGPGTAFPHASLMVFPDGTVIAIVISIVIFFVAVLSGFETDELKAIVAMGGLVKSDEEEDATPAPAPMTPGASSP